MRSGLVSGRLLRYVPPNPPPSFLVSFHTSAERETERETEREAHGANEPPSRQDVFIIATSACARLVPRRRGYNQLPAGRGRSSDDENRLIDQLDEDWDD